MKIQRLLQIPKVRLLKKIIGYDEIYTIAIRYIQDDKYLLDDRKKKFDCIPYSGRFWYADPVLFSWEDRDYIFAEAFDRQIRRGHIVAAEIGEDCKDISFQTAIKEEHHMSFPMVFEWDGGIYMIPETSACRSIKLYRSIDLPYKWELEKAFDVERELVDTVVMDKGEKLLLLTSEIDQLNPLKVRYQRYILDKDNGYHLTKDGTAIVDPGFNLADRNAGKVFDHDGSKILPTQRSTRYDYGVFLAFRQIEKDIHTMICEISPFDVGIQKITAKNIIGIHTYTKIDGVEAIDLRYLRFSPIDRWKNMWRYWRDGG